MPKTGQEAIKKCLLRQMKYADYDAHNLESIRKALTEILSDTCKSQFEWHAKIFFYKQRTDAMQENGTQRVFSERAIDELEKDSNDPAKAAKFFEKYFYIPE